MSDPGRFLGRSEGFGVKPSELESEPDPGGLVREGVGCYLPVNFCALEEKAV